MPRWAKALIAIGISVLVIGVVAEVGLRMFVPGIVERIVREQLDLPRNHEVNVELGGSAVIYALGGGLGDISVDIPDTAVVDGASATLSFHADRLPFAATSRDMTGATASVFVKSGDLGPMVSLLTSGAADTGKTGDGEITVGRSIDAFGFSVPISASIKASVEDGKVKIVPTGLSAVGFDLSADQLGAATGGLLEPLLQPHVLCVSDRLPAGAMLEDIKVSRTGVRVDVSLAPDFFSNTAQLEPGVCK